MFDVKKVDAAIERIAERICKNNTVKSFDEMKIDVQMTTALAELIKARTELEKNTIVDFSTLPPLMDGNPIII